MGRENGSQRSCNCSAGWRNEQGGQSAVVQSELRRNLKRLAAARFLRRRQQYLFFHGDVAKQTGAELAVGFEVNLIWVSKGTL